MEYKCDVPKDEATHIWRFRDKDLIEALTKHIISKYGKLPDGKITLSLGEDFGADGDGRWVTIWLASKETKEQLVELVHKED